MKGPKIISWITTAALMFTIATGITTNVEAKMVKEIKPVTEVAQKNVITYFPNWAMYNAAHQSMQPKDIPWTKVNIVNHSFFSVSKDFKITSIDTFADYEKSMEHSGGWDSPLKGCFGEYKYYKGIYPDKKVLVSVGGWTRGENFHAMAMTAQTRKVFTDSVVAFLKQYPFIDGIDIDWEYPGIDRKADLNDQYDKGCPGGPEDKVNYTLLLQDIRAAYNANGLSGKMLTVAAAAGYDKMALVEPSKYEKYLDYMNVMTYDIHGAWELTTNHQAALYVNPADPSGTTPTDLKNKYTSDYAMKAYRDIYKISPSKLNMGSPFYSRGWKGVKPGPNGDGLYQSATGAYTGSIDNPSSPGGQEPWFKLKQLETTPGWNKYYDTKANAVYLYNASKGEFLTYEDEKTLNDRCDYVNANGYGGMLIWDASNDNLSKGSPMTTIIWDKMSAPVVSKLQAANLTAGEESNGSYKLTATLPANNTATSYTIMEGTKQVSAGTLVAGQNTKQTIVYDSTGKVPGTYEYTVVVTDGTASLISNKVSVLVPVVKPISGDKLLVGYWHNFDNGTGIVKLRDVSTKWDVLNISFGETSVDRAVVEFSPCYGTESEFKSDVAYLQSKGKKVVLSIGGQNGVVLLPDNTAKEKFVKSLEALIDKYGFDGVDIDLESGISLNGGDTDFKNPSTPQIVNLITAIRTISEHYSPNFILSMAPETAYVQGGYSSYGNIWGAYLPIIYGVKDKLTYIHVQHYNAGSGVGMDGVTYNQGTADYEVAMADMLLHGFPVGGNANNIFPALRENQVMIGLPSCSLAAPSGGYINPTEMKKALDYIMKGIPFGGKYTISNAKGYPGFKGLMTWSINWDAKSNYEFLTNYRAYFDGIVSPVYSLKAADFSASPVANGSFTLTAAVPGYNTATSYKFIDSTGVITSGKITPQTSQVNLTQKVTSKNPGTYTYTAELSDGTKTITSNQVTVIVIAPIVNKLQVATLTAGSESNGEYKLTATVPANNTATSYTIMEGTKQVNTGTLVAGQTTIQTIVHDSTGKAPGTYDYTVVVTDGKVSLISNKVSVVVSKVVGNLPAKPSLSQDSWNGGSTYKITMNMWWGENGTSWNLYENGVLISTKPLVANGSNAQIDSVSFKGKATGTYVYKAELVNATGATLSETVTYTVSDSEVLSSVYSLKAAELSASTVANGSFTLKAAVPGYNTASSYKFKDSTGVITSGIIVPQTLQATLTQQVASKEPGTYIYTVELFDGTKTITSNQVTVTVTGTVIGQVYPVWTPGVSYKTGDIVSYSGQNYKCLQGHTSLQGWDPIAVASLWQEK
ncbi:hypothetical protein G9F71_022330 [Clostridium sp. FP2]|uniref:glycosyl hydrolase family 18 protein n=1 Tax=Clostridium sp. FP2 TaxID=2724481 RepID=UPI0013E986AB|nr:glycosyl hydrolase family 18 protein [Clostridium sp. FP2]MBZ9625569.1 hypothetical protein [Clostridium sp. FP2]